MDETISAQEENELGAYLSPLGAWALAIGTSIGWGSFVVTCNTYLAQAGPAGSILGMLVGFAVMLIIDLLIIVLTETLQGVQQRDYLKELNF